MTKRNHLEVEFTPHTATVSANIEFTLEEPDTVDSLLQQLIVDQVAGNRQVALKRLPPGDYSVQLLFLVKKE